jgi:hypothetical protein
MSTEFGASMPLPLPAAQSSFAPAAASERPSVRAPFPTALDPAAVTTTGSPSLESPLNSVSTAKPLSIPEAAAVDRTHHVQRHAFALELQSTVAMLAELVEAPRVEGGGRLANGTEQDRIRAAVQDVARRVSSLLRAEESDLASTPLTELLQTSPAPLRAMTAASGSAKSPSRSMLSSPTGFQTDDRRQTSAIGPPPPRRGSVSLAELQRLQSLSRNSTEVSPNQRTFDNYDGGGSSDLGGMAPSLEVTQAASGPTSGITSPNGSFASGERWTNVVFDNRQPMLSSPTTGSPKAGSLTGSYNALRSSLKSGGSQLGGSAASVRFTATHAVAAKGSQQQHGSGTNLTAATAAAAATTNNNLTGTTTAAMAMVMQAVGAFLREATSLSDHMDGTAFTSPSAANLTASMAGARSSGTRSPVSLQLSAAGSMNPLLRSPSPTDSLNGTHQHPTQHPARYTGAVGALKMPPDQVGRRLQEVLLKLRQAAESQASRANAALADALTPPPQAADDPIANRVSVARQKRRQLDAILKRARLDDVDEDDVSGDDGDDDDEAAAGDGSAASPRKFVGGGGPMMWSATGVRLYETATDAQTDIFDPAKIQNLAHDYVQVTAANDVLTKEMDDLMHFIENEPEFRRVADAIDSAKASAPNVKLVEPDDQGNGKATAKTREEAVQRVLKVVQGRLRHLELERLFDEDVRAGVALALAANATEPARGVDAKSIVEDTRQRSLKAVLASLAGQVSTAQEGTQMTASAMRAFPRAMITNTAAAGCSPQATYTLIEQLAAWWNEWAPKFSEVRSSNATTQKRTLERMVVLCDRLESLGVTSMVEYAQAVPPQPRSTNSYTPPPQSPQQPTSDFTGTISASMAPNRNRDLQPTAAGPNDAKGGLADASPCTPPSEPALPSLTSGVASILNYQIRRRAVDWDERERADPLNSVEGGSSEVTLPRLTRTELVASHLHETGEAKRQALLDQLGDSKIACVPGAFATAVGNASWYASGNGRPRTQAGLAPLETSGGFSLAAGGVERDLRSREVRRARGVATETSRPGTVVAGNFAEYVRRRVGGGGALTPPPTLAPVSVGPVPTRDAIATSVTPDPGMYRSDLVTPSALKKRTHRNGKTAKLELPEDMTDNDDSGSSTSSEEGEGDAASPPAYVPPPTAAMRRHQRQLPTVASLSTASSRAGSRAGGRLPGRVGRDVGLDDEQGRHWNTAARLPIVRTLASTMPLSASSSSKPSTVQRKR